jgi:Ca2+:H+ antiporter
MYLEHADFAECVTAVNVSVKDQLSLSVSVAVGSSIVSLFHFSSLTKLMLMQANHPLNYPVSVNHHLPLRSVLMLNPVSRFMVTLGWIMDRPLALLFDPFESVVSIFNP